MTCLEAVETSEIRLWDSLRKAAGDISLFLSMSKEPKDSNEEPKDDDVASDDEAIGYRRHYENLQVTPLWDSVLHQSYPLLRILDQCLVRSFVTSAQFNSNVAIRMI